MPCWIMTPLEDGSGVVMVQRLTYKRWGWTIRRKTYSCGKPDKRPTLCVDLTLTNTGDAHAVRERQRL